MEQRKASDILLSLEDSVKRLTKIVEAQSLNIKILTNALQKLANNELVVDDLNLNSTIVLPTNSMLSPDKEEAFIDSEFNVQEDKSPNGFRRTSRSSSEDAEVVKTNIPATLTETKNPVIDNSGANKIPIVQRVVDKSGKSLFLAQVDIFDLNSKLVAKVKTNTNGKYQAQLPPGKYKVEISKFEPMTKTKLEAAQSITIDPNVSIVELPVLIVK